MKTSLLLTLLFLTPVIRASDCCETPAPAPVATAATPAPQIHPVKGVIMGLMPDQSALLVKHEEVPGVMRAMTMVFKVDPAVLTKVQRGDPIRALMSRRKDGWWLTEVEVIASPK